MFARVEEEAVSRQMVNKQLREVANQLQEIQEDLDTERECRSKAEKMKRDLNEVSKLHLTLCLSIDAVLSVYPSPSYVYMSVMYLSMCVAVRTFIFLRLLRIWVFVCVV